MARVTIKRDESGNVTVIGTKPEDNGFFDWAFGKVLAADVFESYSAGTETKPQINQDAVRLMKELYGIDMEKTQYSKLISAIPTPDIAISMGCNVGCPFIGRPFDENWGLDDPTGKSDDEFKAVVEQIRQNVLALKSKLCGSSF